MKIAVHALTATLLLASNASAHAELPIGWGSGGYKSDAFEMTRDPAEKLDGKSVLVLRSKPNYSEGEANIGTSFSAEKYAGKRVRFSAWLRTADVSRFAGMWMRVNARPERPGEAGKRLRFDNLARRKHGDDSVKGSTNWTRYDIVLDVPQDAWDIGIGCYLVGPGAAWMGHPIVEVVPASVPVTSEDDQPARGLGEPQLDLDKR